MTKIASQFAAMITRAPGAWHVYAKPQDKPWEYMWSEAGREDAHDTVRELRAHGIKAECHYSDAATITELCQWVGTVIQQLNGGQ
jgi:hypothetical protein